MDTIGQAGFQKAVAAAQNSWLGNGGSPHRTVSQGRYVDHGHHALMEISAFQHAGGYCEAMIANEDAELDRRLSDLGYSIYLDPGSTIRYQPRTNIRSLWRQYLVYGQGRSRTIMRHGMKLKLRQALPLLVPAAALLAILTPISFFFSIPIILYWLAAFSAGVLIGGRAGGGWTRLAGLAAIVMHAAWGFGFLMERLRNPSGLPPRHGFSQRERVGRWTGSTG
jgi:succinoglycan biosynthesis protein ExoA